MVARGASAFPSTDGQTIDMFLVYRQMERKRCLAATF